MTDLEITRLCAEATGLQVKISKCSSYTDTPGEDFVELDSGRDPGNEGEYDPLHDDAQAMALVKRFFLYCAWDVQTDEWECEWHNGEQGTTKFRRVGAYSSDLNRAICECVAKMKERG